LGSGGVQGYVTGGAALVGAGVTAFYMTRVMLMTFFGEKRWAEGTHPHEAPALMSGPLIVLAFGSVFSGGLFAVGGTLKNWLGPVGGAHQGSPSALTPLAVSLLALAVVAIGFAVAYRMYGGKSTIPVESPAEVSVLTTAA